MKYSVAIVEDEKEPREQMQEYISRYAGESEEEFSVTCFTDGDEITERDSALFDIIFMDVQMCFMDGITAAGVIRKRDPDAVLVFVTNMRQYAVQGYRVEALDYLLKPVAWFCFRECMARAIRLLKRREKKTVVVCSHGGKRRMDVSELMYVESQRHTMIYHTKQEKVEVTGTMRDAEEMLAPYHFFRANKGYLINLAYVDALREGCAFIGDERLTVSRYRKNEFMEALTSYWCDYC